MLAVLLQKPAEVKGWLDLVLFAVKQHWEHL